MSENKQYLGSLFSIPDLRDYRAVTSEQAFPEEFALEMPKVKNQGSVGSCVAHSLSTATEYFNKKETGTNIDMSTGYIYGNRLYSTHKGSGMYTRDAIKTLSKYGNVPYVNFPDNVEVPYAIELFDSRADELEAIGLDFKIASYFRLDDDNSIKAHLTDGNLVIFSMYWFDDIKIERGIMKTNQVKSATTGGHCMVIYGWNKDGWLVQNSWGELWGDRGRFVLPYNISRKETWGIVDAKSSSNLRLDTPFKSKLGAFVAKVIHKIISIFYNLKNSKKE